MKYLKIAWLHFEKLLQHRSTSFVWFLIASVTPILMILFWNGALGSSGKEIVPGWGFKELFSYYLLLMVVGITLMSHVERMVSRQDIHQGQLVVYITKPFSYFWFKFFEETPYRALQGLLGMIVLILVFIVFKNNFVFNFSLINTLFSFLIIVLAYFISYLFKMILGISGFWLTNTIGLEHLSEVIVTVFAGNIAPLPLLPEYLKNIANILPFSYMIYYPIVSILGKLSTLESLNVVGIQLLWLLILHFSYNYFFAKGVGKFTGVGN